MKRMILVLPVIVSLMLMITSCAKKIEPAATPPSSGDGGKDAPFLIANIENLYWISQKMDTWDKHFEQTADIDASATKRWVGGTGWNPIGTGKYRAEGYIEDEAVDVPFRGSYNGNGYVIDGLYIDRPLSNNIGLFGFVYGGNIDSLGVTNIDITGGDCCVGGLVGSQIKSVVSNCYSTGTVSGNDGTGGLVGRAEGNLKNCYSTANVSGRVNVGGLAGMTREASISNCYSTGNVTGDIAVGGLVGYNLSTIVNSHSTGNVTGETLIGGLIGSNYDEDAIINNSHSTGNVVGNAAVGGLVGYQSKAAINDSYSTGSVIGEIRVRGLVGVQVFSSSISNSYSSGSVKGGDIVGGLVSSQLESTISNSYSTGFVKGVDNTGGLVGIQEYSDVSDSFWDVESSGQPESTGGTGKTTAEMKTKTTFTEAGWDFVDIWDISSSENRGYPFLSDAQL